MRTIILFLALTLAPAMLAHAKQPVTPKDDAVDYKTLIDQKTLDWLLSTYKMLHASPELSHHEEKTSAFFASELRKLGFTVVERIGKFERPEWTGFGVVGILKNGTGPTVLLRTELDALPVTEATGLPFASTVRTKDDNGLDVGVMHACGHDLHMAAVVSTARIMAGDRSRWHGTLVVIGQPAEER